jgi:hypothetical protein
VLTEYRSLRKSALRSVSAEWPRLRLGAAWNRLPGARPARKFTNRDTALRRLWMALQEIMAATG